MTKLDISNCTLNAEGGKALAAGLKDNQWLTELNLAGNSFGLLVDHSRDIDMSGIIALADAIPDMGAISTIIVNKFPLPIQDIKSKVELEFSGKELGVEDAIIIAALFPSNVS
jgi:hypothetical protein